MHYTVKTDQKRKLIHYRHSGDISAEDIGLVWQEFLAMEEFTQQKFNLISDYREARFLMTINDVSSICDFLVNIKEILHQKKQALVITEPLSTALSILFTGEVNERVGFNVKVFSTIEAAVKWATHSYDANP